MLPPAPARRASYDAVVLGAGPAGLASARSLAAAGRSVAVVDRSERVGGMAGSFEVGGQRVDFGSHRLHPAADPEVLAGLRVLLGRDLQVRPRHGRVRLAERWIGFPLRASDLLTGLPRGVAARAVGDALTAPLRRPRADTYAEVVRAQLGPTILREMYGPYARKLWDRSPDELDGELARRRISARSNTDLLRRLARSRKPEGRTFLYPAGGFGQISESLAAAAVADGVTLLLGHDVLAISPRHDGASVDLASSDAIAVVLDAAVVVSTLPVTRLAALATPAPPAPVAEAARALTHRGMVLVYLVLDRPQYSEFDAHYFPSLDTPLSRLSEPKNYRDAPDRDPRDTTVLCAELPCTVGDGVWTASDVDLAGRVVDALRAMTLPNPEVVGHEVVRVPSVYPVYECGFQDRLAPLLAWVASHPRLVTLGRQGLFVGDNTHHALAMGAAVGPCVRADGSIDTARWMEALDRFTRHVVED